VYVELGSLVARKHQAVRILCKQHGQCLQTSDQPHCICQMCSAAVEESARTVSARTNSEFQAARDPALARRVASRCALNPPLTACSSTRADAESEDRLGAGSRSPAPGAHAIHGGHDAICTLPNTPRRAQRLCRHHIPLYMNTKKVDMVHVSEVTSAPSFSAGPGGGRCPGSTCSRRPWNTVPSSAACASTASDGSANCASAMPLDRLVVLQPHWFRVTGGNRLVVTSSAVLCDVQDHRMHTQSHTCPGPDVRPSHCRMAAAALSSLPVDTHIR
jgi:hypothetical protein